MVGSGVGMKVMLEGAMSGKADAGKNGAGERRWSQWGDAARSDQRQGRVLGKNKETAFGKK